MPAAERNRDELVDVEMRGTWSYLVGIQSLEEFHCPVEISQDILLWAVVLKASGFQGADTSAMLIPFVLPEVLVGSLIVLPVGPHIE
jgi:hypothetical protein